MLRQIFVDGVYHADSHPGNVLVRPDGTLALIDFGSVGRFDALQQAALARALLAVSRRDPRQLRDVGLVERLVNSVRLAVVAVAVAVAVEILGPAREAAPPVTPVERRVTCRRRRRSGARSRGSAAPAAPP